jgi:ribosomal protein L13E
MVVALLVRAGRASKPRALPDSLLRCVFSDVCNRVARLQRLGRGFEELLDADLSIRDSAFTGIVRQLARRHPKRLEDIVGLELPRYFHAH